MITLVTIIIIILIIIIIIIIIITIIMIIINVRSFPGFQLTIFKNKHTFMKNVVLHTTTLMHCKPRQVLPDLFKFIS